MKTFRHRRVLNLSTCAIAAVGTWWIAKTQIESPRSVSYVSGYLLGAVVLTLTSLHWRKRLTVLPLGRISTWTQIHLYVGLYSFPTYVLHAGLHWPDGRLEQLLAVLFLSTSGSGVWGLYITRTYPSRLTRTSEQFTFEQIPRYRAALERRSRQLVLQSATQHGSSTLANHYVDQLSQYFAPPRPLLRGIIPSPRSRRLALQQLDRLDRFLTAEEREASRELFHLIRKKDELEYQYGLQLILKSWLVVHLALTYCMVVAASLHAVVALAFQGGTG